MSVVLRDFHYLLPNEVLSSEAIEDELSPVYQKLHMGKGRIEALTGIKQRHIWPLGTRPSLKATEVASQLLQKSNLAASEVDLLIYASVCRDFLEPASAAFVHEGLGLPRTTPFLDISNACLSVLSAIDLIYDSIGSQKYKNVLIVSSENASPLIFHTIKQLNTDPNLNRKSFKYFLANLTLGSAATAMIISHSQRAPHHFGEISPLTSLSDSSASHLCQGDGNGHALSMQTDSIALMQKGIGLASETWSLFKQRYLIPQKIEPKQFITHQVGKAHQLELCQQLQLNLSQTPENYSHCGNTGSSALPLLLMQTLERGQPKPMALLGIGSGLSSIMGVLQ